MRACVRCRVNALVERYQGLKEATGTGDITWNFASYFLLDRAGGNTNRLPPPPPPFILINQGTRGGFPSLAAFLSSRVLSHGHARFSPHSSLPLPRSLPRTLSLSNTTRRRATFRRQEPQGPGGGDRGQAGRRRAQALKPGRAAGPGTMTSTPTPTPAPVCMHTTRGRGRGRDRGRGRGPRTL